MSSTKLDRPCIVSCYSYTCKNVYDDGDMCNTEGKKEIKGRIYCLCNNHRERKESFFIAFFQYMAVEHYRKKKRDFYLVFFFFAGLEAGQVQEPGKDLYWF